MATGLLRSGLRRWSEMATLGAWFRDTPEALRMLAEERSLLEESERQYADPDPDE